MSHHTDVIHMSKTPFEHSSNIYEHWHIALTKLTCKSSNCRNYSNYIVKHNKRLHALRKCSREWGFPHTRLTEQHPWTWHMNLNLKCWNVIINLYKWHDVECINIDFQFSSWWDLKHFGIFVKMQWKHVWMFWLDSEPTCNWQHSKLTYFEMRVPPIQAYCNIFKCPTWNQLKVEEKTWRIHEKEQPWRHWGNR